MAFLRSASAIASSLEAALATAFGPLGYDRFVRSLSAPHEVVITSSGDTVLQTLALPNPIAQVITDAAAKLQALAGDGSTTLVLLLAALLRQAEAHVGQAGAALERQRRLLAFRTALLHLKQQQLEPLLLPLFRAHVLTTPTADTPQLRRVATALLRTVIGPTLGPAAPVELIVDLALETLVEPWAPQKSEDDCPIVRDNALQRHESGHH